MQGNIMNLRVSYHFAKFLSNCTAGCFSRGLVSVELASVNRADILVGNKGGIRSSHLRTMQCSLLKNLDHISYVYLSNRYMSLGLTNRYAGP
jgi:hypothetical protein